MYARFFVSRGSDFASASRQDLYDQDNRLLAASLAQGSNLSLGPTSDVATDIPGDRIGLYDAGTTTFRPAYTFGAQSSDLTAATGGYWFDFRPFTGNATVFGGDWGDLIYGGSGNDALDGGAGADKLCGNLGNDTLDGGAGADMMLGGKGDDVYVVDHKSDQVREAAGEGQDVISSKVSFVLQAGSEVEVVALDGSTGTMALNLIGNEFVNTLIGNDGANRLDGKAGADIMAAGKGNDVYYVDDYNDRALEDDGGGRDTVYATADHCLVDGQYIETLRAAPGIATGLHLMGNELAQTIIGGVGDDTLHGDGGADLLQGMGGNDRFAFVEPVDATPGASRPTIVDFTSGEDSIFLKPLQAVDGAAADHAFTWIGTGAFSNKAGQLHQVAAGSNTLIEGDTNGDGVADIQILLKGVYTLQATDFTL